MANGCDKYMMHWSSERNYNIIGVFTYIMKIIPYIILTTLLPIGLQVMGQQEELNLYPVTENVYVINGAGCNVVFQVTEDGILVVDAGEKPSMTEQVLLLIKEVSGQPIRYLILTHYHHTVGADEFPQTTIMIAQTNTRSNIPLYRKTLSELMGKDILKLSKNLENVRPGNNSERDNIIKQIETRKKQLDGIKQQKDILPQITFDANIKIHLGVQSAEILYLGPGHTNGDVIIHFPEEKVLCVGDLIYTNGWIPRLDGDAGSSVDNWIKIFEHITEMDVNKIIPGHGKVIGKEEFIRTSKTASEYLTDLKAEVKKYVDQKHSLEYIKANLRLPKYQEMGMSEVLLPWNIEGAYNEVIKYKVK